MRDYSDFLKSLDPDEIINDAITDLPVRIFQTADDPASYTKLFNEVYRDTVEDAVRASGRIMFSYFRNYLQWLDKTEENPQ